MPREDTQFKPGQSGNPGGRAVGSVSLITAIKRYLRRHPEKADEIAEKLVSEALNGDKDWAGLGSIKVLLDRTDGAVTKKQEINVTGNRTKLVRLEGDEDDEPGGETDGGDE